MNGEMYGPIGRGLNAHGGHGHGHGHGHHSQHGHSHHQAVAGPSTRHTAGSMDESLNRKEKKRKESSKLSKEMSDRRDDGRHFTESISALHNAAHILSTRPEMSAYFNLRLYPLSLERSALLAQLESEERVEKGRDRVRERLLEGIEERRKRAREGDIVDGGDDESDDLERCWSLSEDVDVAPP
ncbi:hypothetical protein NLJ89_g10115 [Agrocybe chaxingu]|uniref:Uncharacterized protein n=1 Tax=Agrocybe chaxingu TaxID=84603 RepID=A0A9W8MSX7_9AGAR|nr:hypothetical protein NLJ89_g10115 [Agrocybe chaxingu]